MRKFFRKKEVPNEAHNTNSEQHDRHDEQSFTGSSENQSISARERSFQTSPWLRAHWKLSSEQNQDVEKQLQNMEEKAETAPMAEKLRKKYMNDFVKNNDKYAYKLIKNEVRLARKWIEDGNHSEAIDSYLRAIGDKYPEIINYLELAEGTIEGSAIKRFISDRTQFKGTSSTAYEYFANRLLDARDTIQYRLESNRARPSETTE